MFSLPAFDCLYIVSSSMRLSATGNSRGPVRNIGPAGSGAGSAFKLL